MPHPPAITESGANNMNADPLILAIDLGTTTCKTLVVDSALQVVRKEAVEYPVDTPHAGWAEQNPEKWWGVVSKSIAKVTGELDSSRIQAIGLSGQMHGLVLLDKSLNPLRPAILWNDQRSAPQCGEVYAKVGGENKLLEYTNNPMLPGYTGGKLMWVRENEPRIYEKAERFCLPKDYIRYRLTSEFATDVSDASGTGLFDIRSKAWSKELLTILELESSWFPHAYESSDFVGQISANVAAETGLKIGTPVTAGGGDAVMQTVGSGSINSGVVLLVIGTGGNVTVSLPQPIENLGARLQVFCHVLPKQWVGMGVTLSAGSSLKWFRDRLGGLETSLASDMKTNAYTLISEQARFSPYGSNGLLFLPYLQGERAPHADPNARGAFIGLNSAHCKADLIRSVMEGVAFSLLDVLQLILTAGIHPSRVNISGGGSASPLWRQIIADVFDREVTTLDFSEDAGAIGAAIIAGVKTGIWSSVDEAARLIEVKTVEQPNIESRKVYRKYFGIYRNLYPALKESFEALAEN